MYQREISVPAQLYRRPVENLPPPPPVRRRKRSRFRRRRKLARFLFTCCAMMGLCILLANAFAPGEEAAYTPPLPQNAPVMSIMAEEPAIRDPAAPDAWNLTLVNPWTPLPEDYSFTQKELSNGHAVDERCYPDLQAMMDACRAAGNSPLICSSYRSYEKQQSLYQDKVNRLIAQGYSQENARAEAGKAVALPGTSEHQLGLAVDIVDQANQNLDSSQEDTAVQKWLMEHSWEYGFILRYPSGKSSLTGIIYEPWHYRYVGKDAAEAIHRQGICLEEYPDAARTPGQ